MTDPIQVRAQFDFSNVSGHVPASVDDGTIPVNQADGLLFTRKPDGTIRTSRLISLNEYAALVAGSGGGTGPANTDALPEGTVNLYSTAARIRAAISVSGSLSYSNGVISYTAPALATVATSGAYADLTGRPALFSGAYADLTGKPTLFSGAYADLTGKPTFATVATSGLYTDLSGRPALVAIATSGSAADLLAGVFPITRHPTAGTAGTYGSGSQIPVITTDGYGHITGITTVANTGGGGSGGGTGTVNPSGTFAANDVILAATTDGTSIKSGGPASTLVRGLVSGTSGIAYAASTGVFTLAAPTTTVLGGVLAATAGANQFQTGISTAGAPTFAQPAFSNLSGSATAAQLPLPTTTAIGGVQANAGSAGQFVTGINASTGALTYASPVYPVTSVAGRTGAVTIASADITDAASINTASVVVKRDASGNFAANVITASLAGNATTATSAGKLTTARTIAASGDASGSVPFDGSADVAIPLTLGAGVVTYAKLAAAALASAASDIWSNVANKVATVTALWAAQAPVSWSYAATYTPDMSTFLSADMTLTGNLTLANPTNAKAGQPGEIYLQQDTTGGRTVTFGSAWKFVGGTPTASTAASAVDVISYRVRSVTPSLVIVASYGKGVA